MIHRLASRCHPRLHAILAAHQYRSASTPSTWWSSIASLFGSAPAEPESDDGLPKRCVFIDGNNLLYGMHRPLKPSLLGQSQLLAPNGTPIGATIGFLNVLHKVVEKFKPQRLCVVFDTPTQTHRKKEDPTYKANRERMDMTLRSQFPLTQFVLDILQVPQVRLPGFEADDLIASYTTASVLVGYDVVVVSEDNDFLQLVREGPPRVSVYKPQRKWHLNEVDVRRVLGGSSPKMQPDMRALQGDRSGKSPGLPGGIEQSQAVSVLEKAGGLVSLLDRLDKVDNATLRTRLAESTEMLMVSYRASKLDDAIDPLPTAMDQFNSSKVDLDLLSSILEDPTRLPLLNSK